MNFKNMIKDLIPNFLIKRYIGLIGGWHGNYKTWEEAKNKSSGYDSKIILNKVRSATKAVLDGKANYERDSYLFYNNDYNYQLLFALYKVYAEFNDLQILDFGGALGSLYNQHRCILDDISKMSWNIVEQEKFVILGKQEFENDKLKFFYNIDDCLKSKRIKLVLFSSVLQYLENPYQILDQIIEKNIKYIFIDRTPFIDSDIDRITLQKVPKNIYKASYPCRLFSQDKFVSYLNDKYKMLHSYSCDDISNSNKIKFKGFLFVRKDS